MKRFSFLVVLVSSVFIINDCQESQDNFKPVAKSFTVDLDCNVAGRPFVDIILSGNDPEGEAVTYAIVSNTNPLYGTLSQITNGNHVTYQANNGVNICNNDENDTFQYHVFDGVQYSDDANVTIHPVP